MYEEISVPYFFRLRSEFNQDWFFSHPWDECNIGEAGKFWLMQTVLPINSAFNWSLQWVCNTLWRQDRQSLCWTFQAFSLWKSWALNIFFPSGRVWLVFWGACTWSSGFPKTQLCSAPYVFQLLNASVVDVLPLLMGIIKTSLSKGKNAGRPLTWRSPTVVVCTYSLKPVGKIISKNWVEWLIIHIC